jgi:hypothetical protein
MTRPSPDELYTEMATLAAALGWSADNVYDIEHAERRRWLAEVAGLADVDGVDAGGVAP